MKYRGLNLGQPPARQTLYSLYYHSGLDFHLRTVEILYRVESEKSDDTFLKFLWL